MPIEVTSVVSIATIAIAAFSLGGLFVNVKNGSDRQREILKAIDKLGLGLAELHREHAVLEARVNDFISEVKRRFSMGGDTPRRIPTMKG